MEERSQTTNRIWIIAAVAVALVAGLFIGKLLLDGDDDSERVVKLSSAPSAAGASNPAETSLSVDDDGQTISDGEIRQIAEAATSAVNGGQVTDIERSDDPGEAYEVEVVKNGREIDVALDDQLNRVPNQRFSD